MVSKSFSQNDSVSGIPGIGQTFSKKLLQLGISSIHDLLHHYPSRFLDYRKHRQIIQIKPKEDVSFLAKLGTPKRFRTSTGKTIVSVTATDPTGKINLIWFNNSYISRLIKPDQEYLIAGKASFFSNQISLIAPTIEQVNHQSQHTRGLVPIYPLTLGITSRFLRQKIKLALEKMVFPDTLNNQTLEKFNLINYHDSLFSIHFPKDYINHQAADKRLAFNYHLQLNINNLIEINKLPPSPCLTVDPKLHHRLIRSLPFNLTNGQIRAIEKSYLDLSKNTFTHRLIQGETGSGKTVVVFFLANQSLADKKSLCLVAPTEILAQQHYQTFQKFGLAQKQIVLVTAKNPLKKIPKIPTIFIGTHALLTQLPRKLPFPLIAIVIDEQHKFGVKQRAQLLSREKTPHLFNLTATPIPRTLALGLLGEVSISSLKEKPKNRLAVKTWVLDKNRFEKSHLWLKNQVEKGSKIFAVCPTIHGTKDKEGAEKMYRYYQTNCGSFSNIYLIHGQMETKLIEKTLTKFKNDAGGILVATTIIEVGVDIPEADVIIIHDADSFGLATLHQLRGRVGRRDRQGYCLLISDSSTEETTDRLKLMEKYQSGLILSKMDLRLRGFGELFGEKQHGWQPVRLKNFWNKKLFKQAKKLAQSMTIAPPTTSIVK